MHFKIAATATLLAATATAQIAVPRGVIHGGGAPPRTYGSVSGFGNVVFPGTGAPPPIMNPGLSPRIGAYTAPYRSGYGRGGGVVAVPYAVPVYYGSYGGYIEPSYPAPQMMSQPVQSMPSVIVNNYYSQPAPQPVVREYNETPLPEASPQRLQSYQAPGPRPGVQEEKATIYLIALKDGTIQAAYGYWLEKDTVHYITTQGSHNRVSLELVNVSFSEQLNRERNIEFKIE